MLDMWECFLSSPAATEYELVSSLFHFHGCWSLHVSVNSLSWKDHYYCRCHKNIWINIFSVQQEAVFNVQENLSLTRSINTCWPQFMANWNISDCCTAYRNAMLSEWSVMWYVRKIVFLCVQELMSSIWLWGISNSTDNWNTGNTETCLLSSVSQ